MAFDDSTVWFGKYKGVAWEYVPDSYLKWLVDQGEPEKKGTKLADAELQARADEGRSVPDEPRGAARPHKQVGSDLAFDALERRVTKLELIVSKLSGGVKPKAENALDFADDSIPF